MYLCVGNRKIKTKRFGAHQAVAQWAIIPIFSHTWYLKIRLLFFHRIKNLLNLLYKILDYQIKNWYNCPLCNSELKQASAHCTKRISFVSDFFKKIKLIITRLYKYFFSTVQQKQVNKRSELCSLYTQCSFSPIF